MSVFDLYSKRAKRLRGETPDVYTYDRIPREFRVQVIHIITDAVGTRKEYGADTVGEVYEFIHKTLYREYGLFRLGRYDDSDREAVTNFLLGANLTDQCLDVIDLSFKVINGFIRESKSYLEDTTVQISPVEAVNELNERFKEHAIGYQFASDEIIRVDSTYIHSEVVLPVLQLLSSKKFAGANEEYLKAHEHYRHGRNKEAMAECLKAFESTMKTICSIKGWQYDPSDTSRKLIQICMDNNLIPSFMQNQFSSLRALLESGIPTIRNKLGGHGQGQTPQPVDDSITRYALNLTGSNIIFLIEQSGL